MPGAEGTSSAARRRLPTIVLAGLVLVGACGQPPPPAPESSSASVVRSVGSDSPLAVGQAASGMAPGQAFGADTLAVGMAAIDTVGGLIADAVRISPFDVDNPAISQLDPLLRKAIQDAARRSRAEGVVLEITSGWRSKGFQQRLFDDAVRTFGSAELAAQFVASPDVSKHVLGQAVDVGPVGADEWLMRNGAQFGLCQIYANEIWHYELVADAAGRCPALRPNAAG